MNWRVVRQLSLLTAIFELACSSPGLSKPEYATDAVIPQAVDLDLTKLPKSKQWKPGDPVYEMPDLKQAPSVNRERELVVPTLFEGSLTQITTDAAQKLWANNNSECKSVSVAPILYNAPENSRWMIIHLISSSPYATSSFLCIAVNRSKDALSGGWYLYDFKIPGADLTLIGIKLTEQYYELILGLNHSIRTYLVSLNDIQHGKASTLIVKTTLMD